MSFFTCPCLHVHLPSKRGVADSTRNARRCGCTSLFTRERVACEKEKRLQDATIGLALALFASHPPPPLASSRFRRSG